VFLLLRFGIFLYHVTCTSRTTVQTAMIHWFLSQLGQLCWKYSPLSFPLDWKEHTNVTQVIVFTILLRLFFYLLGNGELVWGASTSTNALWKVKEVNITELCYSPGSSQFSLSITLYTSNLRSSCIFCSMSGRKSFTGHICTKYNLPFLQILMLDSLIWPRKVSFLMRDWMWKQTVAKQ
jgi:hypothetical protein